MYGCLMDAKWMVHGCQWIFSDCGQQNATAIYLGMVSATHTNRDSADDLELGLPDYIVIIYQCHYCYR